MSTAKPLLLGISLLLASNAFPQVPAPVASKQEATGQAPTTEEEYNYLTKGYAIQISSGLDMKKGYTMKDMGNWSIGFPDGRRDTQFKGLMRDSVETPCAILMIYRKADGVTTYCCIPTLDADPSLWERTMKQIHDAASAFNSSGMDTAIILGLMKLSASQLVN